MALALPLEEIEFAMADVAGGLKSLLVARVIAGMRSLLSDDGAAG
ncbi:hypothetical protein [Actinoplanes sp. NBRC 103695]|nr:hypothetical protein [Actinoplanes sp. NBRC 103695]GLZ01197.1 hypothetical protein Acsp02_84480 [Actinoplanes sp. NBRC 103695]